MNTRSLRPKHGDAGVEATIPKSLIVGDGFIPPDASPEELPELVEDVQLRFSRIGEGTYIIRVDDGERELPDLEQCRTMRQLAASMTLTPGSSTSQRVEAGRQSD